MVIVKVLWEPELLGPWKVAWDRLIWKAMIPKVKAIEGELNWNPRHLWRGDLSKDTGSSIGYIRCRVE